MGRKIFISYKYADNDVENITDDPGKWWTCTVRDYVDVIEETLKSKTIIFTKVNQMEKIYHSSKIQLFGKN